MWWLLVIVIILLFNNKVDPYKNYSEYPIQNCPKNYNQRLQKIIQYPRTIQPFGYTDREYLDKIRFVITKEPLPVNADFFI